MINNVAKIGNFVILCKKYLYFFAICIIFVDKMAEKVPSSTSKKFRQMYFPVKGKGFLCPRWKDFIPTLGNFCMLVVERNLCRSHKRQKRNEKIGYKGKNRFQRRVKDVCKC